MRRCLLGSVAIVAFVSMPILAPLPAIAQGGPGGGLGGGPGEGQGGPRGGDTRGGGGERQRGDMQSGDTQRGGDRQGADRGDRIDRRGADAGRGGDRDRGDMRREDDRGGPRERAGGRERRGPVQVTSEQRSRIRGVFRGRNVENLRGVDFAIRVGTPVPARYRFQPLPPEILSFAPEYEGYDYIIVDDQILILDPYTRDIVAVIS